MPMGYEIPIFFVPIDPTAREWSDTDAAQLIGDSYNDRERTGLRSSVSRNWWHIANVREAALALNSSAFDFLEQPVACLDTAAIAKAIQTLAAILAEASGGLKELATTCTAEASEFFLKKDTVDTDADPRKAYIRAFLEAKPSYDIEWSGDAGYGASVGYFAFLKSLLLCLTECLSAGKYLLYYRPQP
jgi:uncharacterized membrane protein